MNKQSLLRKKSRISKSLKGTASVPRLAVFRSNKHVFAQIIDDSCGKTLFAASDIKESTKVAKTDKAMSVGKIVAEKAIAAKIKKVKFDRGGFLYHGRVKNVAEGARSAGLEF